MATGSTSRTVDPNDWQTVDPGDWETVSGPKVPGMEKLGGHAPSAAHAPTIDALQGPSDAELFGTPTPNPKDADGPGFFRSAYNQLPHPIDAVNEWIHRPDKLRQASDAARQEREAASHGQRLSGQPDLSIASGPDSPGALPSMVAGPAVTAGEQMAEGNPSGAAGSLVGGYGQYAASTGIAKAAPAMVRTAKAAGTGIKAAAPEMATGAGMIAAGEGAGELADMALPHGVANFVKWPARVAGAYPGAKLMYSGAKKGLTAFSNDLGARNAVAKAKLIREEQLSNPRSPVWEDSPPSNETATPDSVQSIPSQLPSGRSVGPAPPSPPPDMPPGLGRRLAWSQISPATPQSPPAIEPIYGDLPSGRVPGGKLTDALYEPKPTPPISIDRSTPRPVAPGESTNRTTLANELAQLMYDHGISSRDAAQYMNDAHWDNMAEAIDAKRGTPAGVRRISNPSDATRTEAIHRLRTLERDTSIASQLRNAMLEP